MRGFSDIKLLIGRENELKDLTNAVKSAKQEEPEGTAVFIEGVAGLGKSALIYQFTDYLQKKDIFYKVIDLQLKHSPQTDYYRVFKELFEYVFLDEKKSLKRAEMLNYILGKAGDFSEICPLLSGPLKSAIGLLHDRFKKIISNAEKKMTMPNDSNLINPLRNSQITEIMKGIIDKNMSKPFVLIIDNLHLVDMSSAYLLWHLSDELGTCPFVLVCTYRPEDLVRRSELEEIIKYRIPCRSSEQSLSTQHIYLKYLTENQIPAFVNSRHQKTRLSNQFYKKLYRKTGGNPLFLEETLKYLCRFNTTLEEDTAIKNLDTICYNPEDEIPNIIKLRIKHLEEDSEDDYILHTHASVIGEHFTIDLLKPLVKDVKFPPKKLNKATKRYRFIREEDDVKAYRFNHLLIHEAFYEHVKRDESGAVDLHKMLAEKLEEDRGINPDNYDPEKIADNFIKGDAPERAIKYLQEAADQARKANVYYELAKLDEKIDENIEYITSEKEVFDLLFELGRTYEIIGDKEKAVKKLQQAVSIAEKMDDQLKLACSLTHLSISLFHYGKHAKSFDSVKRALKIFESKKDELHGDDIVTYGFCLEWTGLNYRSNHQMELALKYHNMALKIGKESKNRRLEAHANANIGAVFMWEKDYDRVLPEWEEALRISNTPGKEDWPWVAHYSIDVGLIQFLLRDFEQAGKNIEAGLRIAKDKHFYDNVSRGTMNKASLKFVKGLEMEKESNDKGAKEIYNEAKQLYLNALRIAEDHSVARLIWRIEHNLGNVFKAEEDIEKAEKYYASAIERIEKMRDSESDKEGFMKHRLRPYQSKILLAWENGDRNTMNELVKRGMHESLSKFYTRVIEGINYAFEEEEDKNLFHGYYIETE